MPITDDILAAAILALTMVRRLGPKVARAEDFPAIPPEVFEQWRRKLLSAYELAAWSCLLKIVLNQSWAALTMKRFSPPVVAMGGLLIFLAWIVTVVAAWKRVTDAKADQKEMGIDLRAPKRKA